MQDSPAEPAAVADLLAGLAVPTGRWRAPLLLGLFGLPGTGKTFVAHRLAARYPLVVLATDAIRQRHGLPSGPATHAVMYEVAAALLPLRAAILFDGIHLARRDRLHLHAFADRHQAHAAVIFTTARPAVIEARRRARQADPEGTRAEGKFAITPGHLARIAGYLEPPAPDEAVGRIDTSDGDLDARLGDIARWLDRRLAPTT